MSSDFCCCRDCEIKFLAKILLERYNKIVGNYFLCHTIEPAEQANSVIVNDNSPSVNKLSSTTHNLNEYNPDLRDRTVSPGESLHNTQKMSTDSFMIKPQAFSKRNNSKPILDYDVPKFMKNVPVLKPTILNPCLKVDLHPDPMKNCVFCNHQQHSSHNCQKYSSNEDFYNMVIKKRLCRNCLRPHHHAETCFDSTFCNTPNCPREDKHSKVICRNTYSKNLYAAFEQNFSLNLQYLDKTPTYPLGSKFGLNISEYDYMSNSGKNYYYISDSDLQVIKYLKLPCSQYCKCRFMIT